MLTLGTGSGSVAREDAREKRKAGSARDDATLDGDQLRRDGVHLLCLTDDARTLETSWCVRNRAARDVQQAYIRRGAAPW